MGIFSGIKTAARINRAIAPAEAGGALVTAGPWDTSAATLERIILADLYADAKVPQPITRAEALTLPSVVKGRALIVEKVASAPLRAIAHADGVDTELEAPAWFHQTGVQSVTTVQRMADTIDDLIFYRYALWHLTRTTAGIESARHLPRDLWRINATTLHIELRDSPTTERWRIASADEVVFFTGPQEPLLVIAEGTIRAARSVEKAWHARAHAPAPAMILECTDEREALEDTEVQKLINTLAKARLDPSGALMYIPPNYKLTLAGEHSTDLLTAGRNSVKLDMAGFLNLPGAALDATLDKSSLTYTTQEGMSSELVDRLAYWTAPIEARLSMDDVTPPDSRIRFDMKTPPSTGTTTED